MKCYKAKHIKIRYVYIIAYPLYAINTFMPMFLPIKIMYNWKIKPCVFFLLRVLEVLLDNSFPSYQLRQGYIQAAYY